MCWKITRLGFSIRLLVLDSILIFFASWYLYNFMTLPDPLDWRWPMVMLIIMSVNFFFSLLFRWAAGHRGVVWDDLSGYTCLCIVFVMAKAGIILFLFSQWVERDHKSAPVTWELFTIFFLSTVSDIGIMSPLHDIPGGQHGCV